MRARALDPETIALPVPVSPLHWAVADFPRYLRDADLEAGLADAFDREGKIPRALEAIGPVHDRHLVLLDGSGELRASQLEALGARVERLAGTDLTLLPAGTADVIVSFWAAFPGDSPESEEQLREADRVLVPGGRLLVVHDYARDDVSLLLGDDQRDRELIAWSDRRGWFLRAGFKVRVLHCWWTFESLESARELLEAAFGSRGGPVAAGLRRPRLSHKIAVYHRTMGGGGK